MSLKNYHVRKAVLTIVRNILKIDRKLFFHFELKQQCVKCLTLKSTKFFFLTINLDEKVYHSSLTF